MKKQNFMEIADMKTVGDRVEHLILVSSDRKVVTLVSAGIDKTGSEMLLGKKGWVVCVSWQERKMLVERDKMQLIKPTYLYTADYGTPADSSEAFHDAPAEAPLEDVQYDEPDEYEEAVTLPDPLEVDQPKLLFLDHLKLDISGPKGNAYAILGMAQDLFRQCGIDKEQQDAFMERAKSADYDHLCATFTAATGIPCINGRPEDEWL